MDVRNLGRREIQTLAKLHGIKANGSSESICKALAEYFIEQAKNMPKTPQTPQLLTPSESRGVDSTATKDQGTHELSASLAALKLRSRRDSSQGGSEVQSHPLTQQPTSGSKASTGKVVLPPLILDKAKSKVVTSGTARSRSLTARPSTDRPQIGSLVVTPESTAGAVSGSRTARPAAQAVIGPSLTPDAAPFMGMDNQLSQLKGMISGATQAYKGVVLIGPQGCGKAALANALARSTKGRFVSLDLVAALSQADHDTASKIVTNACRACEEALAAAAGTSGAQGPVVLLVRRLDALMSALDDPLHQKIAFRVKADLMTGLIKLHTAACNKARAAPRALQTYPFITTVATLQSAHGTPDTFQEAVADGTFNPYFLSPVFGGTVDRTTSVVDSTLYVPQPSLECREAVLYHYMCKAEAELDCEDMAILCRITEGLNIAALLSVVQHASASAASRYEEVSRLEDCKPGLTRVDCAAALQKYGRVWPQGLHSL